MILFRNFSSPLYSPLVFANLDESRLFFQFVKRCIELYTTIYVISLSLWKPSNLVSMYIKCLEIIFTFVSHPPCIDCRIFVSAFCILSRRSRLCLLSLFRITFAREQFFGLCKEIRSGYGASFEEKIQEEVCGFGLKFTYVSVIQTLPSTFFFFFFFFFLCMISNAKQNIVTETILQSLLYPSSHFHCYC